MFHTTKGGSTLTAKKVVQILYPGDKGAENPFLFGCAENELGIRELVESHGHELVTLNDQNDLYDHLDMNVLIGTPFYPPSPDGYVLRELLREKETPNLELLLTAGVGSDHYDRSIAAERGLTIAEVTGSNVVSVAEHTVMQMLILVRDFLPAYNDVVEGGWNIGNDVVRSHDIEGKTVGIVGAGRIGQRVAKRLKPFDVRTLYYDAAGELPGDVEAACNMHYCAFEALLFSSDIVTIHCPLIDGVTRGLFNREKLELMAKGFQDRRQAWERIPSEHRDERIQPIGPYLLNTARGAIVERDDLVEALQDGTIAGYAGDVWSPQPAPADHPWRYMKNHAMTPHTSGTALEPQARYAAGVYEMLEQFFNGKRLPRENLIVEKGEIPNPHKA